MRNVVMAHIAVARHAVECVIGAHVFDHADGGGVTLQAVVPCDLRIEAADLNVFGIGVQGESQTVVEAVDAFDDPLVGEAVRRVAIVADATALWLEWLQPSNWPRITWQFVHAFGSSER